jgi:diadenosine tetraphosphatase ApaH/serine/threonine PP2A family protein phosphatase
MKAILSDVHGNLEALQAVLADIARHHVEAIYCLGDLVGYGPDPRECVDLAMQWRVVLLGNFDLAVQGEPEAFGVIATRSLLWSRAQIDAPAPDARAARGRWAFLAGLARQHEEGDFLFVHGSARNPLHEYVFPEDVYNPRKMQAIFSRVGRVCFHGHTHIPGIFTEDPWFYSPEEFDGVWHLEERKSLCNVGSVGQPRDGDWRACYVLWEGDTIRFRRVEYDIETTVRKVRENDDLDDFSGDRLRPGR